MILGGVTELSTTSLPSSTPGSCTVCHRCRRKLGTLRAQTEEASLRSETSRCSSSSWRNGEGEFPEGAEGEDMPSGAEE